MQLLLGLFQVLTILSAGLRGLGRLGFYTIADSDTAIKAYQPSNLQVKHPDSSLPHDPARPQEMQVHPADVARFSSLM